MTIYIPGIFQAQSTSICPLSQGPAHDQGGKPLPVQKLYLRYRICPSYTAQQWTPHRQDLKQNIKKKSIMCILGIVLSY